MNARDRYEALHSMIEAHMPGEQRSLALEHLDEIAGPPWHEFESTDDHWALRHPLGCRDDMLNCVISRKMSRRPESPVAPGRYKVFDVRGDPTELEFWPGWVSSNPS